MGIMPPSSPAVVCLVSGAVAVVCLVAVCRPTAPRSTPASRYLLAGLAGATLWAAVQVAMLTR